MRVIQIMLAAMFLFGAVHAVSAQENRKNEELVVFHVSMSCHSCEQKINKNIPYEKGVQDLTVELEKRLVTIKYRTDKTDKDKLKKAIEKLGFTCEEVRKEN